MKSRTTLKEEKFMQLCERKTPKVKYLIKEFSSFWNRYDRIYHTNHGDIIERLYFSGDRKLEDVAFDSNIDDKTLYRYRKGYIALLDVLCEECNLLL